MPTTSYNSNPNKGISVEEEIVEETNLEITRHPCSPQKQHQQRSRNITFDSVSSNGNKSSNNNISRHEYDNRNNSGNRNNNNNRNNSKTKDNTIILPTTVPITSYNSNPNKGLSVELEIEKEKNLEINRHHCSPRKQQQQRSRNITFDSASFNGNKSSNNLSLIHI